jgi:hypothetical protein
MSPDRFMLAETGMSEAYAIAAFPEQPAENARDA